MRVPTGKKNPWDIESWSLINHIENLDNLLTILCLFEILFFFFFFVESRVFDGEGKKVNMGGL